MEGTPKEYSPEEKAELQQSRILSDAELIKNGAKFIPDSNGEPVLEVPSEIQNSLEVRRQATESQKLLKIIKKTGPIYGNSAMMGPRTRYPVESLSGLYNRGISIYTSRFNPSSGEEVDRGAAGNLEYGVSVTLEDDEKGLPYFMIHRTTYIINSSKGPRSDYSKKCYSFKEYYDALKPEEKEKGEALGKELESYLEG